MFTSAFSLLVNGDFIVTGIDVGYHYGYLDFQSPSKWRFHCNKEKVKPEDYIMPFFQSPSKWRFHCNAAGPVILGVSKIIFQSPSKWRFHCNTIDD